MTDHQQSSSAKDIAVVESLIEFPISTDRYAIYIYFCYASYRIQFIFDDPIDIILYAALLFSLTLFSIPFFFVRSYKAPELKLPVASGALTSQRSHAVPDLFSRHTRRDFVLDDVHFSKSPDNRFLERSSITRRLVFVPEGAFLEENPDKENNIAQLHHDIGHTVFRDYIYLKAGTLVIIDMIVFYFVHGSKFNFSTYLGFWIEIIFALFIFIIGSRAPKFLHAREYRADVYGHNQVGDKMTAFLRQGASLEKHFRHTSGKRFYLARLFHPTFSRRLERLTLCMPDAINCSHIKGYARESVLHSRLLTAVAGCTIYLSGLMVYSNFVYLMGYPSGSEGDLDKLDVFAFMFVNLAVVIVCIVTSQEHIRRTHNTVNLLQRLR